MKSVLISIQPKWCDLIASGKKTVPDCEERTPRCEDKIDAINAWNRRANNEQR